MLPIKHIKDPLGKGCEAYPTAFSMHVKVDLLMNTVTSAFIVDEYHDGDF